MRHPLQSVPFSALGRYVPATPGDPFDSVEIVPHASDPRRYTCITLGGPEGFALDELDAAEAHAKIQDLLAVGATIRPGDHFVPSQRDAAAASTRSEAAAAELETLRGKPTAGISDKVVTGKVGASRWAGLDGETLWTRESRGLGDGLMGAARSTPTPGTPDVPSAPVGTPAVRDAGGRTDAAFDELLEGLDAAVPVIPAPSPAPVAGPASAAAGTPVPSAGAHDDGRGPLPSTPRLATVDFDELERAADARGAVAPGAASQAASGESAGLGEVRSRFAALKNKRQG